MGEGWVEENKRRLDPGSLAPIGDDLSETGWIRRMLARAGLLSADGAEYQPQGSSETKWGAPQRGKWRLAPPTPLPVPSDGSGLVGATAGISTTNDHELCWLAVLAARAHDRWIASLSPEEREREGRRSLLRAGLRYFQDRDLFAKPNRSPHLKLMRSLIMLRIEQWKNASVARRLLMAIGSTKRGTNARKRAAIMAAHAQNPTASDREIARRTCTSPTTVGAVRKKLDSWPLETSKIEAWRQGTGKIKV